mmetsp:Transcript_2893/g.6398  ORF Transcript_2893/g.6398 Transcript_2893/m.6398 type:complete len:912 (+) Transcript_2893:45-2780(+)
MSSSSPIRRRRRRDIILGIVVLAVLLVSLPNSVYYLYRSDTTGTGLAVRTTTTAVGNNNNGGGGTSDDGGGAAATTTGSATSGRVFTMKRIRTLPYDISTKHQGQKQQHPPDQSQQQQNSTVWHDGSDDQEEFAVKDCKYWGTLTTIFDVTEAARKIANLPGWCLVVTGDRKGPDNYDIFDANNNKKKTNVVFLSAERQQQLADVGNISFVSKTPWNHFARKNIAYLYAVAHGAQFIFDFDDDNVLLDEDDHYHTDTNDKGRGSNPLIDFSVRQSDPQERKNVLKQDEGLWNFVTANHNSGGENGIRVLMPRRRELGDDDDDDDDDSKCLVFNNYNAFITNTTDAHIWPRGFPLDDISLCHRTIYEFDSCVLSSSSATSQNNNNNNNQIVIWQSVAQVDPDVDGIYRLTRRTKLPVEFDLDTNSYPVVVPTGMFSPMNAQAALFDTNAAFTLFLPTTVHGRVSDIWRSYIAQTLFQHMGLQVAFAGRPLVAQFRNAHNYLADFMAEEPLYERTGPLVEYLSSWTYDSTTTTNGSNPTTQGALEQLYIDLYEHGILELDDVILIQEWIDVLESIGYNFPPWTDSKKAAQQEQSASCTPKEHPGLYKKVAIMGQFNHNHDVNSVVRWARKWSTVFYHFQARGPFSTATKETLRAYGIDAMSGRRDGGGMFSPMTNIAKALRDYAKVPGITGVVYAQDDMIVNISLAEEIGLGSDHTIVTQIGPNIGGADLKQDALPRTEQSRLRFEPIIFISTEGKFSLATDPNRTYDASIDSQYPTVVGEQLKKIIPPLAKAAASDERLKQYIGESAMIPIPPEGFADFAYMPISASALLSGVADVMADNAVGLESGLHIAALLSKQQANLTSSVLRTCLAQDGGINTDECSNDLVGLFESVKLGEKKGEQLWDEYFDISVS